ncbi:MAG: flagellar basal-body MS-ring/collar protein FliF [Armatimonadota bacterium]|nr:flagellar basal-body MS-ring/collar protein FliF [Armatimonadota bacterium]MDW8103767.1 flagellar basal-body MS-ring/collar protein FliF [Armatimonadota bacterium]
MLQRVREWWQTSDRQTRLIAVASAAGLVVVMIALSFWATQPEWEVLYTGLSATDSGAIVARLKQAKVPYRLSAGGSTIEVPASYRDEMLLSLAAEGLPNQGTLGYSRLEKLGFGTTQTVEQETTRIAHEEALQNTILRLQPIAGARVHITPAIDSPFVGEKKPAKASVMVDLKPGQQLTREQIASIVFLVSRSVAGLSPENVSVVDEHANLLWDGSQASDMAPGVASNKLELERAYAETVQRQLQQQLDAVLGPGKSRLTVTVELDMDREEVSQKQIDAGPDGQGIPVSETRTEETVRGAAPAGAGGAIGTPTYPTAPAGAPGEYKHSSTTTNYEVGQSTIHRVKTPGRVARMSVAAMIDASVPAEQVEKVRAFLEGAVGADQSDPERRFRVIVESIPFDNTLAKEAEAARRQLANRQLIDALLRYLPLVALLVVLLLVAKALRPTRAVQTPEGVVMSLPGGTVPEGATETGEEEPAIAEEAGATPTPRVHRMAELPQEEVEITPIRERVDVNLESIIQLANQKPEKVAMLIKGWLAEDER